MTNLKFILISQSKWRSALVIFLTTFTTFLIPKISNCQKTRVAISINKDTILIGEPAAVDISITVPPNSYKIIWPERGAELNSFQITDPGGPPDSLIEGESITFKKRIYVTSFDSGTQTLPPIPINLEGIDKNPILRVSTQKLPVEVVFSKDDGVRPFHDIKSVIAVPDARPAWLKYLIPALLLLIFFVGYLLIKKKKTSSIEIITPVNAYKEAILAIRQLESEIATGEKKNKEYFNRLIFIFRRYLSLLTGENKMSQTSSEMISDLHEEMEDKELFFKTANGINLCEAVIFAKFKVSNKDLSDSIGQIEAAIDYFHKKNVK